MAKCIAIIPARGGSKRIPKKNIKDFFGKPLIAYSIEVALNSNLFDKVVVTTDDREIAKIAKKYGAEIPFIRPKELSDDFSGTTEVVNHAIDYLAKNGETYDYVCTIYATAPLLQSKYLIQGYNNLKNSNAIHSFSATTMPFPIQRTFKLKDTGRCEMFTPEYANTRSQDLEEAYQDAGQFYWKNNNLDSDDLLFGRDSIPVLLPRHLVQDIDTFEDWVRAEAMYKIENPDIFDKWNTLKQKISSQKKNIFIKEKNIYLVYAGYNIGAEIYGKGSEFLRPVLVYKKLSHNSFIGIPLSSKQKDGSYYFNFKYKENIDSCALFNQLKVFDSKRMLKQHGVMKNTDYSRLKYKFKKIIDNYPQKNEGGCSSSHKNEKWQKDLIKEIDPSITQEDNNVK